MAGRQKKVTVPLMSEQDQQKVREQVQAERLLEVLNNCFEKIKQDTLSRLMTCPSTDLQGLQAKLIACKQFKDELQHIINEGKRVANKGEGSL